VASWAGTFDDYCNDMLPPAKVTNIMMGDLQRIWVYAARGFSAPQQIPDDVKLTFHRLVELGFTEHLHWRRLSSALTVKTRVSL